ncbi:hypothetical protein BMS3Abin11_01675 [bacterium BMS3Abin11]|nr:hypothetical protein BMS3Abin11_01675 [bacterium BMS3Abin11]GMT39866.1 MAG: hypothetical protein IEMM0001_0601 [bacterium]HDH08212.1 hypothetical protein [Gammaproteobacteria bacterium]HDZ78166.1 hypothetical protein [Gammaproteobacteria bacterium]
MKTTALQRAGILIALFFLFSFNAWSAENLKPFMLVASNTTDFNTAVESTKNKLQSGGFDIVGEYSPYAGAEVIVVSSDELKASAAKTKFGGYGAVVRVSVTKDGDKIEVAYSNPVYWADAYRLDNDQADVAAKLITALGDAKPFGSEKGLTAKKLRKYHYMAFMPYFDDPGKLGGADSYADLLAKINSNLEAGKSGIKKVYEVKIPGKDETVIGVAMTKGAAADKSIMGKIDIAGTRHTAHLPYEMLVSGNEAYALSAKFRIALSFPDLSMIGKGSFVEIMDAPPAIKEQLSTLTK